MIVLTFFYSVMPYLPNCYVNILGKEIESEDVDNLLNTQDWHRFPEYEGEQLSSPR